MGRTFTKGFCNATSVSANSDLSATERGTGLALAVAIAPMMVVEAGTVGTANAMMATGAHLGDSVATARNAQQVGDHDAAERAKLRALRHGGAAAVQVTLAALPLMRGLRLTVPAASNTLRPAAQAATGRGATTQAPAVSRAVQDKVAKAAVRRETEAAGARAAKVVNSEAAAPPRGLFGRVHERIATWNQFQAKTKGQFRTRKEAAAAWKQHKQRADDVNPAPKPVRNHLQDIVNIKRQKGLGDIAPGVRADAEVIGKAWVNGPNVKRFDLANGGYGLTDGTRTFRLQFKPKSGKWKANFQENVHIPGRKKGIEVKNIHMTITDMTAPSP